MKIHELKTEARKRAKRVGRGIGSGKGKTAGRGTKGQLSRSGGNLPPYFEGGQNPLVHRLPKQRGFKSLRRTTQIIKTSQLNRFKAGQSVGAKQLKEASLISSSRQPVKLLKGGELKKALTLHVQSASRGAKQQLEAQGGQLEIMPLKSKETPPRQATTK